MRGVGAVQGGINGQFRAHLTPTLDGYKVVNGKPVAIYRYIVDPQTIAGPMDMAGSSGGRYGDVGVGISAVVPRGAFAGNRISLEWLQPVADDVKGYQLARIGTLSATWDFTF